MKKAFGLAQAIMLILFIGSIAVIGVKYARVSVNHYQDTYLKEQARLFIQSLKERVLFDITTRANCQRKFTYTKNIANDVFTATVDARYAYFSSPMSGMNRCVSGENPFVHTSKSNGIIALKIVVRNGDDSIYMIDRSIQRP